MKMNNSSLNEILYEQLEKQCNDIRDRINVPLFKRYADYLELYRNGEFAMLDGEDIEEELAEKAADISSKNPYADFIETHPLDEQACIQYLKEELKNCFQDPEVKTQLLDSGAIEIGYDWYFHYDSGINFFKKGLTFPIIAEPRYLYRELPPGHYVGFAKGPNFSGVWPDCAELIDEADAKHEMLGMGYELMNYYQHLSRLFLHKALREMDEEGEFSQLKHQPFPIYIAEHDCEEMTLYVK
jgi:hypothetical protein